VGFDSRAGIDGQTIIGFLALVRVRYRADEALAVEAGAVPGHKFGDEDELDVAEPLVRLAYEPRDGVYLIGGTIIRTRLAHDALLDEVHDFREAERGLEVRVDRDWLKPEAWINWRIREDEFTAEEFEVGSTTPVGWWGPRGDAPVLPGPIVGQRTCAEVVEDQLAAAEGPFICLAGMGIGPAAAEGVESVGSAVARPILRSAARMHVKSLIPSMFHRRLLLLLGVMAGSVLPLGVQLGRLTLVRGDDLRREAEARLVRTIQTPSVRGRIVDRKGRVLAEDRPSYDIAVAYPVITGDWVRTRAREAARRAVGTAWAGLGRDGQTGEVARYMPAYQAHLDRAWDRLAATLGITRAELESRRDEIIRRVAERQAALTDARVSQELRALEARGVRVDEGQERAIRRRAAQPIAEAAQAHAIAARVSDTVGFACHLLAGEEARVGLPASADRLNASREEGEDTVEAMPGLRIIDSGTREYPHETMPVSLDRSAFPSPVRSEEPLVVRVEGVACHLVGRMRDTIYATQPAAPDGSSPATLGDADRRGAYLSANPAARARAFEGVGIDRGAYRDGDRVGASGLEASAESTLRGLRGVQTSHLDTGERAAIPPVPGSDLHLTIDIQLQARVQALLTPDVGLARVQPWHKQENPTQRPGDPLNGAAVVLDIETGDILAMVSTPTFTRVDLAQRMQAMLEDRTGTPLLNRAVSKYYTPGSIVKPLLLCAAVKRGVYQPGRAIDCTGHLFPDKPQAYRCWIYKRFGQTHTAFLGHEPGPAEAITVSCNIFFFTIGQRLGPEGVIEAYQEFGVGRTFDLGVGGEAPGKLGFKQTTAYYGLQSWDAIQMGIGQGPVTWTPLHAAAAYATLARGGIEQPPRLVAADRRGDPRDLGLDRRTLDDVMEGLRGSVNEEAGTGHHIMVADAQGNDHHEPVFNVAGVNVWGKTGTADAPAVLSPDPDGSAGPRRAEVLEDGDHSWFVVLCGRGRPRYVVAVVVDFGGSGGKVSGPICNQVIHALVAEGYL
jgi:penicillin-binding protein 2